MRQGAPYGTHRTAAQYATTPMPRTLTKSYDKNYRIDAIADPTTIGGGIPAGLNIDFSSDLIGNLTALDDRSQASAATRQIDYDGLDRLKAQKNGATNVQSFAYDATGNRTSLTAGATTTAYTYPATSHRLTGVGSTPRSFDAMGNTTQIGSGASAQNLSYNDRGRLSQYKIGNKVKLTNRYNARGERVAKIAPQAADSRFFVYGESGQLLGEYTSAGARIAEYVWLDDLLVAVLSDHDGTTYQFVETDHLGTPRMVIHPGRNLPVWRWDIGTTAFGEHAPVEDPDGDTKKYVFNLRYPGQYFDAESGLNYNYFRNYDPGTGRYVESDPIGLKAGFSTFTYSLSRPLSLKDPKGLDGSPFCGGGTGVGFNDPSNPGPCIPEPWQPKPKPEPCGCETITGFYVLTRDDADDLNDFQDYISAGVCEVGIPILGALVGNAPGLAGGIATGVGCEFTFTSFGNTAHLGDILHWTITVCYRADGDIKTDSRTWIEYR